MEHPARVTSVPSLKHSARMTSALPSWSILHASRQHCLIRVANTSKHTLHSLNSKWQQLNRRLIENCPNNRCRILICQTNHRQWRHIWTKSSSNVWMGCIEREGMKFRSEYIMILSTRPDRCISMASLPSLFDCYLTPDVFMTTAPWFVLSKEFFRAVHFFGYRLNYYIVCWQ